MKRVNALMASAMLYQALSPVGSVLALPIHENEVKSQVEVIESEEMIQ